MAEEVFEAWVAEHDIDVFREQRLDTVRMSRDRIVELRMQSGLRFRAAMFIDATYEGDLLARAGTSWFAGREGNAAYGETLNGVQFRSGHQFRVPVDPYVVPGNPSSGLLAGISADPPGTTGEGDHRIQAFNFRVCLTRAADRLPFPKPAGYDPARYELLLRYIQAGIWDVLGNNQPMPNGKTDWNNNGAVSSDNIGRNYDWPDTDYAERERIFQDHVTYQQGLLWFLANDPRVPAAIRAEIGAFGLPRDEFPRDRRLAARAVHPRGAPDGLRLRDDRARTAAGPRTSTTRSGWRRTRWTRTTASGWWSTGSARNEGDVQVADPGAVPDRLPLDRAAGGRVREPARAGLPVGLAHRLRVDPDGAGVHGARPGGGHGGVAGDRRRRGGPGGRRIPALRRQLLRDRAVLEWPPPPPGLTVEAPELRPGVPATVTVTLVNDDVEPYEGVELSLTGPWSLTPIVARARTDRAGRVRRGHVDGHRAGPARAGGGGRAARAGVVHGGGRARLARRRASRRTWSSRPARRSPRSRPTEAHFGARGDRLAVIAGGADLWTGIDQYGALFLDGAGGPGTVAVTRLVSQDPTDPNARAGLAMRNDLTGAGRAGGYVLLVAKPQNGFLLLWDADGSGTVESVARSGPAATPSPAWLRLARNGTTFTGAWSLDGVAWTTVGTATVPSAAAVQDVGLVVCSHAAALGRAVFDGLEVRTSGWVGRRVRGRLSTYPPLRWITHQSAGRAADSLAALPSRGCPQQLGHPSRVQITGTRRLDARRGRRHAEPRGARAHRRRPPAPRPAPR